MMIEAKRCWLTESSDTIVTVGEAIVTERKTIVMGELYVMTREANAIVE